MANFPSFFGPGQTRSLGLFGKALSAVISSSIAVMFLAIAAGYYVEPSLALHVFLGAILCLAFLHRTGGPTRPTHLTLSACLLAGASLVCCGYLIFEQGRLRDRLPVLDPLTTLDIAVAIVLVLLVLEATRRCIGMTLVLLVSSFLLYGFLGDRLEGAFYHRGMSLEQILDHLIYTTEGVFGPALEVAALLVFVFVIFGALFDRFGGGEFFYQLAQSLVGNQTGGSAKVAVLSSALYGSVSGSPTADVVTTGSFTIPLMIKTGFSRVRASAVEAAASTGGSLLPPVMGSAAFLMSDFTGIAYSEIVIAAILPAFFYFFCVYMSVNHYALKHQLDMPTGQKLPALGSVLRKHWLHLIPLITIAWAVLSLNRPAFAGALACLAVVPVMLSTTRPLRDLPKQMFGALIEGVERVVIVGVACAVAGLVIGTLSMTDLTGKISSAMFAMASGSYALTVGTAMLVTIVLGMGMPVPAVYALAAVLAAPALVSLGAEVLSAHLFIVYFAAVSAITPPVAVAAFAAASISGANPMSIGLNACRIGIVAFIIPLIFLGTPELLLQGTATANILNFITTLIACWALSGVTEGYLMGSLKPVMRIALALLTLLILATDGWLSAVGSLAILGLLFFQWRSQPSTSHNGHHPQRNSGDV